MKTVFNLEFRTRYVVDLEEAIAHHIALTHIVQTLLSTCGGDLDDNEMVSAAVRAGLHDSGASSDSLGLAFVAYICYPPLRHLSNHNHVFRSPTSHDINVALHWRRKVLAALSEGWPSVRALWIEKAVQQGRPHQEIAKRTHLMNAHYCMYQERKHMCREDFMSREAGKRVAFEQRQSVRQESARKFRAQRLQRVLAALSHPLEGKEPARSKEKAMSTK